MARGFPLWTIQEIGIVEILYVTQAFRRLFTLANASELTKVFETLDTRGYDYQKLRTGTAFGREGVRQLWRHDDDVTRLGSDDLAAGEHLNGTAQDLEHFG